MTSSKPGIGEVATRPTRRAAREQQAGLGSMLTADEQTEPPAPEPAPVIPPSVEPSPASASRISASARKVQKVPFSTQIDMNTARRVEWLIRTKGYKKTDITGDALDALLDSLAVPPADKIKS